MADVSIAAVWTCVAWASYVHLCNRIFFCRLAPYFRSVTATVFLYVYTWVKNRNIALNPLAYGQRNFSSSLIHGNRTFYASVKNSFLWSLIDFDTIHQCNSDRSQNKNSSGDEIANVNFFLRDIVHVEASAYAHWTDFLISTINIYARPNLCT